MVDEALVKLEFFFDTRCQVWVLADSFVSTIETAHNVYISQGQALFYFVAVWNTFCSRVFSEGHVKNSA